MEPIRAARSPRQLIRNFAYLSGAEIASKVLTFVAVAYVARLAGPVSYGYVEYCAAVLLCAGLVVDQGFGPYGAREIARTPDATSSLVTEVVTARVLLALGTYLLLIVPTALLARSPMITQLLLLYGLSLVGTPLLLQWVFQGHDRMGAAAATQLVRQAVYALVVFGLIHTADDVWYVALAELAGVCAAATYGAWMVRRLLAAGPRVAFSWRPRLSRKLFVEGVPIGLGQLFWMVKMFGATLIVGAIARPEDVGLFAGAQRILVAAHAFVFVYYFNLLPSLARAWRQQSDAFESVIVQSLRSMVWLSMLVALVWVLLAPRAMSLVYGAAFESAGPTLQWLAGMWLVAAISGHYRFALIAADHQRAEMATAIVGAVVTIILVPVGYAWLGLVGAGIALCTAEVVIWLSAWRLAQRALALPGHVGLLVRPALSGALALSVGWLTPGPDALKVGLASGLLTILALVFEPALRHHTVDLWVRARRLLADQIGAPVQEVA